MYGKKVTGVIRSTFVVDEEGKIEMRAVQRQGHRPRRQAAPRPRPATDPLTLPDCAADTAAAGRGARRRRRGVSTPRRPTTGTTSSTSAASTTRLDARAALLTQASTAVRRDCRSRRHSVQVRFRLTNRATLDEPSAPPSHRRHRCRVGRGTRCRWSRTRQPDGRPATTGRTRSTAARRPHRTRWPPSATSPASRTRRRTPAPRRR